MKYYIVYESEYNHDTRDTDYTILGVVDNKKDAELYIGLNKIWGHHSVFYTEKEPIRVVPSIGNVYIRVLFKIYPELEKTLDNLTVDTMPQDFLDDEDIEFLEENAKYFSLHPIFVNSFCFKLKDVEDDDTYNIILKKANKQARELFSNIYNTNEKFRKDYENCVNSALKRKEGHSNEY